MGYLNQITVMSADATKQGALGVLIVCLLGLIVLGLYAAKRNRWF